MSQYPWIAGPLEPWAVQSKHTGKPLSPYPISLSWLSSRKRHIKYLLTLKTKLISRHHTHSLFNKSGSIKYGTGRVLMTHILGAFYGLPRSECRNPHYTCVQPAMLQDPA